MNGDTHMNIQNSKPKVSTRHIQELESWEMRNHDSISKYADMWQGGLTQQVEWITQIYKESEIIEPHRR